MNKKWGARNLNVKVVNHQCGRIDFHKNLSSEEVDWIALDPNLEVEVVDYIKYSREQDD